jgi:hypothetical protein
MALLSGSASVSRFIITARPDDLEFDDHPFQAIVPGSAVRERIGFVPFELDAPYRIGQRRWAFRVRIDVLRPDPTAVRERLRELEKAEREATGNPFLSARKRRNLRQIAEEELLTQATPRSKVIECAVDDMTLWVGSTAKNSLGMVLALLRQIDVVADFRTPWFERGDDEPMSEIIEVKEPGQSVWGCLLLKKLLEDADVMLEPEAGSVRLATRDARITLSGAVMNDVLRYVERGAEVLAAKLATQDTSFRLDALNWRIASLRIECESHEHWQDLLDERLEHIAAVYELLDAKYATYRERLSTA